MHSLLPGPCSHRPPNEQPTKLTSMNFRKPRWAKVHQSRMIWKTWSGRWRDCKRQNNRSRRGHSHSKHLIGNFRWETLDLEMGTCFTQPPPRYLPFCAWSFGLYWFFSSFFVSFHSDLGGCCELFMSLSYGVNRPLIGRAESKSVQSLMWHRPRPIYMAKSDEQGPDNALLAVTFFGL